MVTISYNTVAHVGTTKYHLFCFSVVKTRVGTPRGGPCGSYNTAVHDWRAHDTGCRRQEHVGTLQLFRGEGDREPRVRIFWKIEQPKVSASSV